MQCHLNGVHISCLLVFSWESKYNYSCNSVDRPLPCSPPTFYPTSAKECDQLFWCVFHKYSIIWKWPHSKDSSHCRRTSTGYHWGQISIPATVARRPEYVSAFILYSLAYAVADVMDNDILTTALSAWIQISMALIGMVKKPSIAWIFLAKQ